VNKLIGGCEIVISNPINRQGYIGYRLNRNFWSQGYTIEAAKALLKFGFEKLNLHRIFAICDSANTSSMRVLEKISMRLEGHLKEHKFVKAKWRDSLIHA